MEACQELINVAAELGRQLLCNGAEIYRVEESVSRLLDAYGGTGCAVFAIPSYLVITVKDENGRPMTTSVRVKQGATDLRRIDTLNHLCRQVCRERPALARVTEELARIESRPGYPAWLTILMTGVIGFGFTLFFGGDWADAAGGALCGLIAGVFRWFFSRFPVNPYFANGIAAACLSAFALLYVRCGLAAHADRMTIGALMNLVPGVALTNGIRDVIGGDLIAGLLRQAEALMTALVLALGVGLSMMCFS